MKSSTLFQLRIMTTEINFSTTTAQETYDRLKRCLDLSEDLLRKCYFYYFGVSVTRIVNTLSLTDFSSEKLNGHSTASSNKKAPQDIVKSGGQSEAEIINEGGFSSLLLFFAIVDLYTFEKFYEVDSGIIADVAPETVEPEINEEIQDSSDDGAAQQNGTEDEENSSVKSTDEKSENIDPEPSEKNKNSTDESDTETEQTPTEKTEDSSNEAKINFTENTEVQSSDLTDFTPEISSEEKSTEQPNSDELEADQDIDNAQNSDHDEVAAAENIVERAIQDALEEETPAKEPTKADLKENVTHESEFVVQKDHTGKKVDFEKIEKFENENEEDIEENQVNGEIGNQGNDLKYYFGGRSELKGAKRSFFF
jgi:hypothetical protein